MATGALVNQSLRGVDLSLPHPLQFERIGYFILDPDSAPGKVRLSHSQSTLWHTIILSTAYLQQDSLSEAGLKQPCSSVLSTLPLYNIAAVVTYLCTTSIIHRLHAGQNEL